MGDPILGEYALFSPNPFWSIYSMPLKLLYVPNGPSPSPSGSGYCESTSLRLCPHDIETYSLPALSIAIYFLICSLPIPPESLIPENPLSPTLLIEFSVAFTWSSSGSAGEIPNGPWSALGSNLICSILR